MKRKKKIIKGIIDYSEYKSEINLTNECRGKV